MPILSCSRLVLFAVILLVVGELRAEPGPGTPVALEMDGRIVVPVRINGTGPFRFRLDTGASRTVISARVVAALGLTLAGGSRLVTPTGVSPGMLVNAGSVQAGCASSAAVLALMVSEDRLDPAGRVDGLIGQDVLAALVYTIDYGRQRLICHDAEPPAASGTRIPLTIRDGRAVVTLPPVKPAGRGVRLVPDTGADRTVLFAGAAEVLPPTTPLDIVSLRGLGGTRLVRRVLVQNLDLGGFRLPDHEGLLLDARSASMADGTCDAMADGLLPLHGFARVTFNGPAGYLEVEGRRPYAILTNR